MGLGISGYRVKRCTKAGLPRLCDGGDPRWGSGGEPCGPELERVEPGSQRGEPQPTTGLDRLRPVPPSTKQSAASTDVGSEQCLRVNMAGSSRFWPPVLIL